jgi:uncharacterized membrane protein
MIRKPPFGAAKTLFGCGVLFFIFFGIVGFIASFFTKNTSLASTARMRSLIGIGLGVLIVIIMKFLNKYID